ncbi:hypothetical protein PCE1_000519 [Barthelona sp. PCE]
MQSILERAYSQIEKGIKIEQLFLDGVRIRTFSNFPNDFPDLKTISACGSNVRELGEGFILESVVELNISDNPINSLANINRFPNLRKLFISNTNIELSCFEELKEMKKLRVLDCDSIEDVDEVFEYLDQLEIVNDLNRSGESADVYIDSDEDFDQMEENNEDLEDIIDDAEVGMPLANIAHEFVEGYDQNGGFPMKMQAR